VIFAIIFLVVRHVRGRQFFGGRSARRIWLFLLVFLLFPGSWILRNAAVLPPDAERGSARAAATLSHGAYPNFIYKDEFYQRFPYREDPEQPAFGSSFQQFIRILSKRASRQPVRYLTWYLFGKPYYLWRWSILQGVGDIYIFPLAGDLFAVSAGAGAVKKVMQILHPWLLVLAAAGVILLFFSDWDPSAADNRPWLPMHFFVVCIYATVLYMVFAPWPRYSIPFRPHLYLCAMWAVHDLIQRVHRHVDRRA
jgi:hypothetical protein